MSSAWHTRVEVKNNLSQNRARTSDKQRISRNIYAQQFRLPNQQITLLCSGLFSAAGSCAKTLDFETLFSNEKSTLHLDFDGLHSACARCDQCQL